MGSSSDEIDQHLEPEPEVFLMEYVDEIVRLFYVVAHLPTNCTNAVFEQKRFLYVPEPTLVKDAVVIGKAYDLAGRFADGSVSQFTDLLRAIDDVADGSRGRPRGECVNHVRRMVGRSIVDDHDLIWKSALHGDRVEEFAQAVSSVSRAHAKRQR